MVYSWPSFEFNTKVVLLCWGQESECPWEVFLEFSVFCDQTFKSFSALFLSSVLTPSHIFINPLHINVNPFTRGFAIISFLYSIIYTTSTLWIANVTFLKYGICSLISMRHLQDRSPAGRVLPKAHIYSEPTSSVFYIHHRTLSRSFAIASSSQWNHLLQSIFSLTSSCNYLGHIWYLGALHLFGFLQLCRACCARCLNSSYICHRW